MIFLSVFTERLHSSTAQAAIACLMVLVLQLALDNKPGAVNLIRYHPAQPRNKDVYCLKEPALSTLSTLCIIYLRKMSMIWIIYTNLCLETVFHCTVTEIWFPCFLSLILHEHWTCTIHDFVKIILHRISLTNWEQRLAARALWRSEYLITREGNLTVEANLPLLDYQTCSAVRTAQTETEACLEISK